MSEKTSALCWIQMAPGAFGLPDGPPLPIPFLVVEPQPAKKLYVDKNPLTLVLGILLTTSKSRVLFGTLPSNEQFLALLEAARPQLQGVTLDEVCVNAAADLRQQFGVGDAIRGLRRACELVPDAVLCRGDLLVYLLEDLSTSPTPQGDRLEEIARFFREWARRDTSECANEIYVFYAGFAALAYLGLEFELQQWKRRHRHRIRASAWLSEQVTRLAGARPGELADVLFPPGQSPWED